MAGDTAKPSLQIETACKQIENWMQQSIVLQAYQTAPSSKVTGLSGRF